MQSGNEEHRWSGMYTNRPSTLFNRDFSAPGQMQDDFQLSSQPSADRQYNSVPLGAHEHIRQGIDSNHRIAKDVYESSFLSPDLPLSQRSPSPMDGLPPIDKQTKQGEADSQNARRTRTFGHPFSIEWLSTRPVPFS